MIWNDPMLRGKKPEPPEPTVFSKDPVLLGIKEAMDAYFFGGWTFPIVDRQHGDGLGAEVYDPPILTKMRSINGVGLPSNFTGPGSEYYDVYGAIVCTYYMPAMHPPDGMWPFCASIGAGGAHGIETVSYGYMMNVPQPQFIGVEAMAALIANYPGLDPNNPFPDSFPMMLFGITYADGSLTWTPLECHFTDNPNEIEIWFNEDILRAVSGVGGYFREWHYGEPVERSAT